MIDPNSVNTVRVGELPPADFILTDNVPHEIGTELYRGTVQQLADLIGSYLGTSDSLSFNPTTVNDGGTLPSTDSNEWMLVGKGTFHNVGGGLDIVTTEELNAVTSNGSYWSLSVQIPINVELAGIVQAIRSGYLQTTPSENEVYNALQLKLNTGGYSGTGQDLANLINQLAYETSITWGYVTAINGETRIISADEDILSVDGSAVTNYTITLPTLTDAKEVSVTFNASVTNLTINAGGVIDYFPPRAKSYDTYTWVYEPIGNQWILKSYWSGDLGAQITSLPNKGTLGDTDTFAISDGSASSSPKKVTALNFYNNYLKSKIDPSFSGLLEDRGPYNASTNLFPSSGGSGTGGAIMKGDIWYITANGTLGGKIVRVDDSIRALSDSPGQSVGNWSLLAYPLQFTAANDLNVIHTTGNENKTGNLTVTNLFTTAKIGAGTSAVTGQLQVRTGTNENASFISNSGRITLSAFNDAVNANIGQDFDALDYRFNISGVQKMILSLSGDLSLNNLGGSVTEAVHADSNGKLIKGGAAPTSGAYTPTLTNTTNVTGASLLSAIYTRIGDIITVYIAVTVNITSASTVSTITATLPINRVSTSSTHSGSGSAAGNAFTNSVPCFYILPSNTTSISITFIPAATGAYTVSGSFSYKAT